MLECQRFSFVSFFWGVYGREKENKNLERAGIKKEMKHAIVFSVLRGTFMGIPAPTIVVMLGDMTGIAPDDMRLETRETLVTFEPRRAYPVDEHRVEFDELVAKGHLRLRKFKVTRRMAIFKNLPEFQNSSIRSSLLESDPALNLLRIEASRRLDDILVRGGSDISKLSATEKVVFDMHQQCAVRMVNKIITGPPRVFFYPLRGEQISTLHLYAEYRSFTLKRPFILAEVRDIVRHLQSQYEFYRQMNPRYPLSESDLHPQRINVGLDMAGTTLMDMCLKMPKFELPVDINIAIGKEQFEAWTSMFNPDGTSRVDLDQTENLLMDTTTVSSSVLDRAPDVTSVPQTITSVRNSQLVIRDAMNTLLGDSQQQGVVENDISLAQKMLESENATFSVAKYFHPDEVNILNSVLPMILKMVFDNFKQPFDQNISHITGYVMAIFSMAEEISSSRGIRSIFNGLGLDLAEAVIKNFVEQQESYYRNGLTAEQIGQRALLLHSMDMHDFNGDRSRRYRYIAELMSVLYIQRRRVPAKPEEVPSCLISELATFLEIGSA